MSVTIQDFSEYTITEFHAALIRGAVSSEELTRWYIERIEALNENGPALKAVVTVNPDAIAQAKATDDYFLATGQFLGSLHGVPILVKDQAETAGLRTTFGSALFENYVPESDSGIVEKVKSAGAVIVAKAAMNDLACGYSSHSTMTCETKNPYDLNRDPGGSSAGTGSGIAANLALVGIGEDTGGSIRVPSSFNNLFGLRVTAGLITRRGLQGLVPVQDTPGPMARTVTDLVYLLDVLAGYDSEDPLTEIAVGSPYVGHFAEILANLPSWSDLRIGVLESAFISGRHEEDAVVGELARAAIEKMKEQGAQVIEGLEIDDLLLWYEKTSLYEHVSRRTLEDFFATHGAPVKDYDEFIEKGYHNPILSTFLGIQDGSEDPAHDLGYTAGLLRQREFRETVLNLMAQNNVDVLVYPTVRELPPKLEDVRESFDVAGFPTNTIIGSQAVLPAMSVPVGFSPEGIPVGMEILTRPLQENRLIQIAALWEKFSAPRKAPVL